MYARDATRFAGDNPSQLLDLVKCIRCLGFIGHETSEEWLANLCCYGLNNMKMLSVHSQVLRTAETSEIDESRRERFLITDGSTVPCVCSIHYIRETQASTRRLRWDRTISLFL